MQIMTKRQGKQIVLEHLGSAHNEAELAVLMHVAHERMHSDAQLTFDLGGQPGSRPANGVEPARVVSQSSRILWDVLAGAYERLGFNAVGDEAFKQLVIARLIEPSSKLDTIRILN